MKGWLSVIYTVNLDTFPLCKVVSGCVSLPRPLYQVQLFKTWLRQLAEDQTSIRTGQKRDLGRFQPRNKAWRRRATVAEDHIRDHVVDEQEREATFRTFGMWMNGRFAPSDVQPTNLQQQLKHGPLRGMFIAAKMKEWTCFGSLHVTGEIKNGVWYNFVFSNHLMGLTL